MANTFRASFLLIGFTAVAAALTGCNNTNGTSAAPPASATGSPSGSQGTGSPVTGSGLIISGSPAQSVSVGAAYEFRPTATGVNNAKLSFSIKNQPGWAKFDATTGTLSGTPAAANVGTYAQISISVSDGVASASLAPFFIGVAQSAAKVTLSWTSPTLNTNGTVVTDLAGYRIYYGSKSTQLNQVVTLEGAQVTAYAFPELSAGTWYFAVAAYGTDKVESDLSAVVPVTI
jgi:Putative Ig domain